MLDCDDSDKRGGPVSNQGDKVLEVDEEIALSSKSGWDNDDCDYHGEGVTRDLDKSGNESLEVERDGVHCTTSVTQQRKRQDHNHKFAKATCTREHSCKNTSYGRLTVRGRPLRNVGQSTGNSSTKRHEENSRCDETKVRVGKDAP
ncbi:hypothetical protein HG531_004907 [Fusarium graminearum]|nr:hypothetical protein HG531_004907 [Fusarium graminearum]